MPRSGSVSESGNVTAGIVGAKGRVKLGESNWFVPFYVDVGGGDSVTTWQTAAGSAMPIPGATSGSIIVTCRLTGMATS
ncbi:MAG: hypothetical protein IPN75_09085 [Dechloromonas sp.]|uniref:Uncharacterized protein n=1 Tax=Candidatus Dechloromonas phosphorivorans TaxID=2899244 RepID=A0A9D7LSU2_9RHOO|nr:hypothetical protein [Candidatus Dechloromonas phosphorivorans]